MTTFRTFLLAVLIALFAANSASAQSSAPLRVVAAENFWGSIAAQLGGDPRRRSRASITNPGPIRTSYEPTADRRAHDRRRAARDRQRRSATTRGPRSCSPRTRSARRIVLTVGDVLGLAAGGNPHQLVLAERRAAGDRRDHRRLRAGSTPAEAAYFEPRAGRLRDNGARAVQGRDAMIRTVTPARRSARRRASSRRSAQALGLDLLTPHSS